MSFIFIARVTVLVGVMNAAREQENADTD